MTIALRSTLIHHLTAVEVPRPKLVKSSAPVPRKTLPSMQNLSSILSFEPLAPTVQVKTPPEPAASPQHGSYRDRLDFLRHRMSDHHEHWR